MFEITVGGERTLVVSLLMARALLQKEDTYAGSTWTGTCPQISTRTITTHVTFGWPGSTQYPTALKRASWHKLVVGSVTRGTSTGLATHLLNSPSAPNKFAVSFTR